METGDMKIKNKRNDNLFKAILELKDLEECYKFFQDICTVQELEAISQRLEVAELLRSKKTYKEIEKGTGASTATISRINRTLNYGTGGYELIFERIESMKDEK